MRFMLEITEAEDGTEITDPKYLARMLRDVAQALAFWPVAEFGEPKLHVRDANGNTVGAYGMCQHEPEKRYTREQITAAAIDGKDLVMDELPGDGNGLGEKDGDLLDITVNAILMRLDNPAVTMNEILDTWEPEDGKPGSVHVREWWNDWN